MLKESKNFLHAKNELSIGNPFFYYKAILSNQSYSTLGVLGKRKNVRSLFSQFFAAQYLIVEVINRTKGASLPGIMPYKCATGN